MAESPNSVSHPVLSVPYSLIHAMCPGANIAPENTAYVAQVERVASVLYGLFQ
jgi:hypothetical protein